LKFCWFFSSSSKYFESRILGDSKVIIEQLARSDLSSLEINKKLNVNHNTLNKIISEFWIQYRVSNLGELRQAFKYIQIDEQLFLNLLHKELSYEEIEKIFFETLSSKNLSSKEIATKLNINRRTVDRKFQKHFNQSLEDSRKDKKYQKEREDLQKKIKSDMNEFNKTKEEIKRELDIGDYLFNTLAKEAFSLDLSPSEIQIYKILEKLDKTFLSQLCSLYLFTISEIRLFFIEKLLRDGINKKEKISNLLHLSTRQIDRLVKEWGKSETFSSLSDKLFSQDAKINEYLIYNIILDNQKNNVISVRDESILNRFQEYSNEYYSLLNSKNLSTKQKKRRFIMLLASNAPNSTIVAKFYGFKDRSSLRYEIWDLWDQNTTFTFLKKFALNQRKIELKLLTQIKDLILDTSIRKISTELKLSTWKISEIIAKHCNRKLFSQFRTYLACKKIDSVMLKNLEEKGFAFKKITNEYIKILQGKNNDLKEISELLKIPMTQLEEILSQLKVSDNNS